MNSKGGAIGLCVPPSSRSVLSLLAKSSAGRSVWRSKVALPAVPMANWYDEPRSSPARKTISVEPISAPSAAPPETSHAAFTQVRCWRMRPGFFRFPRMWVMRKGCPVTMASVSAVRSICPPPVVPSICMGFIMGKFISPPSSPSKRRSNWIFSLNLSSLALLAVQSLQSSACDPSLMTKRACSFATCVASPAASTLRRTSGKFL